MKPKFRVSIAGMMVAVAVVAVDCVLLMLPATFAGVYLTGIALQVGLAAWAFADPRGRRFVIGFEATGWALLLSFLLGRAFFNRAVVQWPDFLYASYRSSLSDLTPEAVDWLLGHFSIPDPNGNLSVLQFFGVLELTFGVPMLLLASAGGLVARAVPGPVRERTPGEVPESVVR